MKSSSKEGDIRLKRIGTDCDSSARLGIIGPEKSPVARLILGTAALGLDYGLSGDGASIAGMPTDAEVEELLETALADGVGAFDTAPAYGLAQQRLGAMLQGRGRIWTKLGANLDHDEDLPCNALCSLEDSLVALGRDRIHLLQWHNWQAKLIENPHFQEAWALIAKDRRVRALGCSTYGVADALAAVESGLFDMVQVEWNLLNQGVINAIHEAASLRGVRLAVRSVYLQGVLSERGDTLPAHLAPLAQSREELTSIAAREGLSLSELALLAALSHPHIDLVLVGARNTQEWIFAKNLAMGQKLSPDIIRKLTRFDHTGTPIVDPRTWPKS